jgi:hypothetical protein
MCWWCGFHNWVPGLDYFGMGKAAEGFRRLFQTFKACHWMPGNSAGPGHECFDSGQTEPHRLGRHIWELNSACGTK